MTDIPDLSTPEKRTEYFDSLLQEALSESRARGLVHHRKGVAWWTNVWHAVQQLFSVIKQEAWRLRKI